MCCGTLSLGISKSDGDGVKVPAVKNVLTLFVEFIYLNVWALAFDALNPATSRRSRSVCAVVFLPA